MRKTIYAMTMAVSMMLASCSKNDEQPEQKNETKNAAITESKLIGKWELTAFDWIYYKPSGQENYRASYTNSNPDDSRRSWITFNTNKTYIHMGKDAGSVGAMLADAIPRSNGEWMLSNGNKTISLDATEWNATKFENSKMQIERTTIGADGIKSTVIMLFNKD